MIYSKSLKSYIPIQIKKEVLKTKRGESLFKYSIMDNNRMVGYIDLEDTPTGIHVSYLQNLNRDEYKGVASTAAQIAVEHCMNRGLHVFDVVAEAGLNSHAVHFKNGQRFLPLDNPTKIQQLISLFKTADINKIVQMIIKQTPKGAQYDTLF